MNDPTLERYVALARRVHELLGEPDADPQSLSAPPQAQRAIARGVYRLAVYVSAMPGAQAPCAEELDELRALHERLERAQR